MRALTVLGLMLSATAWAEGPSLSCPAGTRKLTDAEGAYCRDTAGRLQGPALGLHKNGTVAARGQYANGDRQGLWTYFDERGTKVREIEFLKDDYHGRYTEFAADGTVLVETTYAHGLKQGQERRLDTGTGATTVVQFDRGQPVTTTANAK